VSLSFSLLSLSSLSSLSLSLIIGPIDRNDFDELSFNEHTHHFCFQSIRNGFLVHNLSIPFSDISTTRSVFENMVTLRYTGHDSSLVGAMDYISTIPIDDWKGILSQQRCQLIQSQKRGPFQYSSIPDYHRVYEPPPPLILVNQQMSREEEQFLSGLPPYYRHHLNVIMHAPDVDTITDSLTQSLALSSVSPPVGKDVYMMEEPDNDLAKHFNQMHDSADHLHSDAASSLLQHPSADLTDQSNCFITNPNGAIASSHREREVKARSHLKPSPKSGTLSWDDDGTGDDFLRAPLQTTDQHLLYRTYSPTCSFHVMNALNPPPATFHPSMSASSPPEHRGSLEPETVPPLSHEPLRGPLRPNTEGSPRARSSQYSRLLRSAHHRTIEGGDEGNSLYPPRPPSSPLKMMMIPTITPSLPTRSSLLSPTPTTTMGQRTQHNNKLRYRGHTAESAIRRKPSPMNLSSSTIIPTPHLTSPHLNRPKTIPNARQLSSPRAKAMHVSYITGVNLSEAMYGLERRREKDEENEDRDSCVLRREPSVESQTQPTVSISWERKVSHLETVQSETSASFGGSDLGGNGDDPNTGAISSSRSRAREGGRGELDDEVVFSVMVDQR
jgi:hypothetical protein